MQCVCTDSPGGSTSTCNYSSLCLEQPALSLGWQTLTKGSAISLSQIDMIRALKNKAVLYLHPLRGKERGHKIWKMGGLG